MAYQNIHTGRRLLLRADEPFHPASTIKICVMMEVFRRARDGAVSLDDRLPVVNRFRSVAGGSAFSVAREDDGDTSLYDRIGRPETIRELTRLMIVRSSNLATNLLIERVGADRVTAYMRALGARGILVRRGVEDQRAYDRGLNNVATARGLMVVLAALARRRVVSARASDEMLAILRAQELNEGIPSGLPTGTPVAHKTGWFGDTYHDAGIVYPPAGSPFVLVVMTRGIPETGEAHRLVASVARFLCDGAAVAGARVT